MQLLGPNIDITQKDIVGNNILDKGSLIVLLLIIGLGAVEGHRSHGTNHSSLGILTLDKEQVQRYVERMMK